MVHSGSYHHNDLFQVSECFGNVFNRTLVALCYIVCDVLCEKFEVRSSFTVVIGFYVPFDGICVAFVKCDRPFLGFRMVPVGDGNPSSAWDVVTEALLDFQRNPHDWAKGYI